MTVKYKVVACHVCGRKVAENWYVRHLKSGCQVGVRDRLSRRQWQIVRRLAMTGTSCRAIAADLGIAHQTVKNHLHMAAHKLDVVGEGKTTVLVTALQRGEVTLDELVAPAHVLARPR